MYADKVGGGMQYTEAGKISGYFKGPIQMQVVHPLDVIPDKVPVSFRHFRPLNK